VVASDDWYSGHASAVEIRLGACVAAAGGWQDTTEERLIRRRVGRLHLVTMLSCHRHGEVEVGRGWETVVERGRETVIERGRSCCHMGPSAGRATNKGREHEGGRKSEHGKKIAD
jgi:hypothetical protein